MLPIPKHLFSLPKQHWHLALSVYTLGSWDTSNVDGVRGKKSNDTQWKMFALKNATERMDSDFKDYFPANKPNLFNWSHGKSQKVKQVDFKSYIKLHSVNVKLASYFIKNKNQLIILVMVLIINFCNLLCLVGILSYCSSSTHPPYVLHGRSALLCSSDVMSLSLAKGMWPKVTK